MHTDVHHTHACAWVICAQYLNILKYLSHPDVKYFFKVCENEQMKIQEWREYLYNSQSPLDKY